MTEPKETLGCVSNLEWLIDFRSLRVESPPHRKNSFVVVVVCPPGGPNPGGQPWLLSKLGGIDYD